MRLHPLALLALLPIASALAQDNTPPLPADATLLQVNAHGAVQHAPDVATIQAGLVTRDSDAAATMRDNAARMMRVLSALRVAGIPSSDVQTDGVSLQAQYSWSDKQPPKVTGYEARNGVAVKLRDMEKVGEVIGLLVGQGANRIDGPNFAVDKPEAALDEARKAALAQARARAELYAQSAGLRVRRIISISETGSTLPSPRPMLRMVANTNASPMIPPIEPGENTLSVDLEVRFELGR